MVQSPVKTRKPVVGSCLDRPCRETCMSGFGHYPAAGFLVSVAALIRQVARCMQHFLSRVFSSKYGRVAIFVIAVLVIAAAIAGWNGYQDTQENKWACLQRIEYVPKGYHLLDEEKRFATQDEALNYCFLESLSHSQPLNLEDY